MTVSLGEFDDIIRVVTQPITASPGVLSGYEFTSLCKLQLNSHLWERVRRRMKDLEDTHSSKSPVTLDSNERLTEFVLEQIKNCNSDDFEAPMSALVSTYICSHNLTELQLDAIFKYGDDNQLPRELFQCASTKVLSLKFNSLEEIPADIGRMESLETLVLTNNKLQNRSLPFTLTFCSRLKELKLDNNLLDALPGFLLSMRSLETVHRHGNHNYFKSTFMWYHTDINQRVVAIPRQTLPHNPFSNVSQASLSSSSSVARTFDFSPSQPLSLQCISSRRIIGNKSNFFKDPKVSPRLKELLSSSYHLFNVCDSCYTACLYYQPGYKVITFKNPYLGNTCIPFLHWTCSYHCALHIEIPAREEQVSAAKQLDKQYEEYTQSCQLSFIEPAKFRKKPGRATLFRDLTAPRLTTRSLLCWCSPRPTDLSSVSSSSSSSSSSSVVLRNHPSTCRHL